MTKVKWLTMLQKQGQQGRVGTLVNECDQFALFKFDTTPSIMMRHEHEIMERLAKEIPLLPHYVKSFGLKTRLLNPSSKFVRRPWDAPVLFPIETVEMEYLHDSEPLFDVVAKSAKKAMSAIVQIVCANAMQWEACRFTHYDLHAGNVLCVPTTDQVHVYSLKSHFVAVRTHGMLPKIIDFGFSHVNEQKTGGPLGFSEYGFLPFVEDDGVDLRFLLCSLKEDVEEHESLASLFKGFDAFLNHIYFNPKRGWVALDINIEDYVMEKFKLGRSDCETSIFSEPLFTSTIRVLLAHSLSSPIIFEEEKFKRAWLVVEKSLMCPFTELLTVVKLLDLTVEEAKTQCFWLRAIEEDVLSDVQQGLWGIQHLLQPILKEAQLIAVNSRVSTSSSFEWFFNFIKENPIKWKKGDVVRIFPEGNSICLSGEKAAELNKKWKTSTSTVNFL